MIRMIKTIKFWRFVLPSHSRFGIASSWVISNVISYMELRVWWELPSNLRRSNLTLYLTANFYLFISFIRLNIHCRRSDKNNTKDLCVRKQVLSLKREILLGTNNANWQLKQNVWSFWMEIKYPIYYKETIIIETEEPGCLCQEDN